MEEKRRVQRFNIQLPAVLMIPGLDENLAKATVLNISAIGISISSKEKLRGGQELQIKVDLPNKEKVVLNTEVIWIRAINLDPNRKYRVGLKIKDEMKDDAAKFVKYFANELLAVSNLKSE